MIEELKISREDAMTRLTLSRMEKSNALNPALTEALLGAFQAAALDGTRLIVVEGAGKSFCSGFDLSDFDDVSEGDLVYRLIRIETLLQTVFHSPVPTLALAHGRVFGAGADLFCACSQRIVAPGTKFRMPGLAFGIVLGTRRLMARIGPDAAREIQNACRTFDAEEAVEVNFATAGVGQSEWPATVTRAAESAIILPGESSAALFRITAPDTRAEDMAELVRSAGTPGLKDRIRAYREQTLRAAGKAMPAKNR